MDRRDALILKALMDAGRTPIRAIADKLGVSVAAVHKRMLGLEERHDVERYRCLAHPGLLGGYAVELQGTCTRPATRIACDQVGENPFVFEISVASQDHLLLIAVVRDDNDLQTVLDALENTLGLTDARIDRLDFGPAPDLQLTPTDWAIIQLLAYRARRPVAEVGRRLGLSDKVVTARLQTLFAERAAMLVVVIGTQSGQWAQIEVQTDGRSPHTVLHELDDTHGVVMWLSAFVHRPTAATLWIWCRNAWDCGEYRSMVLSLPGVVRAVPTLIIGTYAYPIWIQDEIATRAERQSSG